MCQIMVTEEQLERIKANTERFKQAEAEAEARKKSEARKSWIETQTCPLCGQCLPLPVWLMG
jgi:ferredoxin